MALLATWDVCWSISPVRDYWDLSLVEETAHLRIKKVPHNDRKLTRKIEDCEFFLLSTIRFKAHSRLLIVTVEELLRPMIMTEL